MINSVSLCVDQFARLRDLNLSISERCTKIEDMSSESHSGGHDKHKGGGLVGQNDSRTETMRGLVCGFLYGMASPLVG
jgi:hypothetical protein